MSEIRTDGENCFVCGKTNPLGLQLTFHLEEDICRAEFTPADDHCGFDGVTHGGIIFSALDDVMANWIYLNDIRAYTAKCEIRYKGYLPTGTAVVLEGRCVKNRGTVNRYAWQNDPNRYAGSSSRNRSQLHGGIDLTGKINELHGD